MHYDSYIPSMMDVLERIDAKLEGTRRRDLRSAVSSFCKAVGKAPQEIAVVPHEIRALREAVSPLALGISERRWANICSGVAKAIELVRDMVPSRNTTPLLPEWQQLLDGLPKSLLRKMSPGARYLSGKGVAPSAVCLDDLTGYCEAVLSNRMRRNAEQAVDEFIWGWNQAVKQHPTWPQVSIPRSDKRDIFSFPIEYFPPSFAQDVEAYLDRLGQGILSSFCDDDDDELDFGPMRPVRPATIETRRRQLRASASALAHSGVAASEITSIAKLVEIANAKKILHFMMQRNADGQTSAGVAQLATFLAKLALHWVKVEPSHHQKLKHLAARVAVPICGMTAKNRERLRAFDDETVVADFVCLPDTIRKAVEKDKRPPQLKARLAQMAAAIAILIVIPLRRRNLAAIDINQHLIANRNGVYLVIPEAQTKNREAVNFQIPSFALEIIKWYIREYRPYLIAGQSSALFPGRGGACKAPHTLGEQVKGTIKQFVGLDFNIHLFRHAAGKIFLDINPGNYEVVRQLLRHKSINTTTSAYSGAETRKAGLLYAELVAGLRAAHEPARKAKRSFP
jgi:integrase